MARGKSDEADKRALSSWGADVDAWRDANPSRATANGSRRRRQAAVIVVVLVVALGWSVRGGLRGPNGTTSARAGTVSPTAVSTENVFREAEPLGTPPAVPDGPEPFRFIRTQNDGSGDPVAYDPCFPVHYRVRPDGGPPGGLQMIAAAVAEVSHDTGLQFVYDGLTDEAPARKRLLYVDGESTYSPVLIAWSDNKEDPDLGGVDAGHGGSAIIDDDVPGSRRYATGEVVLDREFASAMLLDHHGRREVKAVLLHELGHLVGLAHVKDESQLMYPEANEKVFRFGAGDLRGLSRLGQGRCFVS